jgi:hypothetical protein
MNTLFLLLTCMGTAIVSATDSRESSPVADDLDYEYDPGPPTVAEKYASSSEDDVSPAYPRKKHTPTFSAPYAAASTAAAGGGSSAGTDYFEGSSSGAAGAASSDLDPVALGLALGLSEEEIYRNLNPGIRFDEGRVTQSAPLVNEAERLRLERMSDDELQKFLAHERQKHEAVPALSAATPTLRRTDSEIERDRALRAEQEEAYRRAAEQDKKRADEREAQLARELAREAEAALTAKAEAEAKQQAAKEREDRLKALNTETPAERRARLAAAFQKKS